MSDQLSRVELFKLDVALQAKGLEELLQRVGAGAPSASEKKMLTEAYRELMELLSLEITEEELDQLMTDEGMAGLKDLLKKAGSVVKKVTSGAANVVKKVVSTGFTVAKKITLAPSRGIVSLILSQLNGLTSKAFIYIFIPANSPWLKSNPTVARKRSRAIGFIDKLNKAGFAPGHLEKIIRNNIVQHYKKSPEDVLHEMARGQDKDLQGVQGMGVIDWAIVGGAVTSIVAAVPTIIGAFKKEDIPAKGDWVQVPPQSANITGDPTKGSVIVPSPNYPGGNQPIEDKEGLPVWAWVLIGTGSAAVVGGGIYLATKK